MKGTTIQSITTTKGSEFGAKIFIDASYEGDVMALAGVSYTWGREGVKDYNESLAGVQKEPSSHGGHQFDVDVDPYDSDGHLLPLVHVGSAGIPGDGDKIVQSYNFRMCFSSDPNNQVPITPEAYNPKTWELFRRFITATLKVRPTLSLSYFMTISHMPNKKTDINNNGAISTDFLNAAWEYPEANLATRQQIKEAHIQYTKEFFYFLANDPIVPPNVRTEMKSWGLAKDEFVKTNNWPHQFYVREARRMVGSYVMTQHDRYENLHKPDTIGLGSYNVDTHNGQRYAVGNKTLNEGDVEVSGAKFELPYRCLVPNPTQCTNLIVPVCVSATHIAYGAIRLEPQYMILGQSSGVAAAQAIAEATSVQTVDITKLQQRLKLLGQLLE